MTEVTLRDALVVTHYVDALSRICQQVEPRGAGRPEPVIKRTNHRTRGIRSDQWAQLPRVN